MTDLLDKALRNGAGELPDAAEKRKAPSASNRERLLGAAVLTGRFERFIQTAADMLDLSAAEAETLLDRVDSDGSFAEELPGVEFFWLPGGPKTADAVRGFVRVNRSADLPPHVHLGTERVLVMQGTYIDQRSGERFGPGQELTGGPEEDHHFAVDEDGTDLLLLVVVQKGYQIGEMLIEPREVPPV